MIYTGRRTLGESTRRAIPALGTVFYKGEWIEGAPGHLLAPHSFLLEQPPNITLESHFHRNNQFQIFVEGDGTIGRHAIGPVVVHYAGAYTGYGPLISGTEGLKYFTLRRVREDGYIPITQRSKNMLPGPKRHASSESWQSLPGVELEEITAAEVHSLIPKSNDGLMASAIRLPPDSPLQLEHLQAGEGQFIFMLAGQLVGPQITMSLWEHIFVPAGEPFPKLCAGGGGAELLCFSLPSPATEYI